MSTQDELFHPVVELPEPVRAERYERLVGVDDIKDRLRKEATVLADPSSLDRWAQRHHRTRPQALRLLADRAPLLLFAGDVGAGKSALAESFGCDLATHLKLPVSLYRLKLSARGSGLVGEMTTLIGDAFAWLLTEGKKAIGSNGSKAILIFVVDEADALVQSREAIQMHHEDRAGVDAFLAGLDSLAGTGAPILVVLCSNRLSALDPALQRRAAATFEFGRPDDEQRRTVLEAALDGLGMKPGTVDTLVTLTGPTKDRPGFTFSDLTQRLVPSAVLRAFPDQPVTDATILEVARCLRPTPVFSDQQP